MTDTVADLEAVKAQLGALQRLTESMPGGQLTEGFLKSWCAECCGVHHASPTKELAFCGMRAKVKLWCRGMILVSEIGDKTFFIAAIMAMKNRRATVNMLLAHILHLSPCTIAPGACHGLTGHE